MSLLDKIIELRANSVTEEEFKETWGFSKEEHMQRMSELIDELNAKAAQKAEKRQKAEEREKLAKTVADLQCAVLEFRKRRGVDVKDIMMPRTTGKDIVVRVDDPMLKPGTVVRPVVPVERMDPAVSTIQIAAEMKGGVKMVKEGMDVKRGKIPKGPKGIGPKGPKF